MMEKYIADWPYIPDGAFLFFPQGLLFNKVGLSVKEGSGENQWRKIFQGCPYDNFEI